VFCLSPPNSGLFVRTVHAHPELNRDDSTITITYVLNTDDPAVIFADGQLHTYVPRFVKLKLQRVPLPQPPPPPASVGVGTWGLGLIFFFLFSSPFFSFFDFCAHSRIFFFLILCTTLQRRRC
jgi:hypothetical protein